MSKLPTCDKYRHNGFTVAVPRLGVPVPPHPPQPSGPHYSDLELEWFRGGPRVVDVTHLVQEGDIISEE